jgi:hypothetical protein
MRMYGVRRALAWRGSVGQLIALEQHDLGEAVAEHARRQQSRETGAEHDGALIIGYGTCHFNDARTSCDYHDRQLADADRKSLV